MKDTEIPIIYSCSGCSNLGQMAHDITSSLDTDGIAQMSCISGVIGKVKVIASLAHSGRTIIAIDGCEMGCTLSCLTACQLKPAHYFVISEFGIEKLEKDNISLRENHSVMTQIYKELSRSGITYPKK